MKPLEPVGGSRADTLFRALNKAILHLRMRTFPRNMWISQEIWSLIDQHTVGSFHNRAARSILSQILRCRNIHWEYPLIGEALTEVGLDSLGYYISRRHTSVTQYIDMRPIFGIAVK